MYLRVGLFLEKMFIIRRNTSKGRILVRIYEWVCSAPESTNNEHLFEKKAYPQIHLEKDAKPNGIGERNTTEYAPQDDPETSKEGVCYTGHEYGQTVCFYPSWTDRCSHTIPWNLLHISRLWFLNPLTLSIPVSQSCTVQGRRDRIQRKPRKNNCLLTILKMNEKYVNVMKLNQNC